MKDKSSSNIFNQISYNEFGLALSENTSINQNNQENIIKNKENNTKYAKVKNLNLIESTKESISSEEINPLVQTAFLDEFTYEKNLADKLINIKEKVNILNEDKIASNFSLNIKATNKLNNSAKDSNIDFDSFGNSLNEEYKIKQNLDITNINDYLTSETVSQEEDIPIRNDNNDIRLNPELVNIRLAQDSNLNNEINIPEYLSINRDNQISLPIFPYQNEIQLTENQNSINVIISYIIYFKF